VYSRDTGRGNSREGGGALPATSPNHPPRRRPRSLAPAYRRASQRRAPPETAPAWRPERYGPRRARVSHVTANKGFPVTSGPSARHGRAHGRVRSGRLQTTHQNVAAEIVRSGSAVRLCGAALRAAPTAAALLSGLLVGGHDPLHRAKPPLFEDERQQKVHVTVQVSQA
jgi:hypothetical protein